MTAPQPGGRDKSRQGEFGGAESPIVGGAWNWIVDTCRISTCVVGGVLITPGMLAVDSVTAFKLVVDLVDTLPGFVQTSGLLHMADKSNHLMIIRVYHRIFSL